MIGIEELIKKYRSNNITQDEFQQLRLFIDNQSDEELMRLLCQNSFVDSDEILDSPFSEDDILAMKQELKQQLYITKSRKTMFTRRNIFRILSRAAILLLPVFIASTLFFWHSNTEKSEEKICFRTEQGEQASVILPDGTTVKLNSLSELQYKVGDFSSSVRQVTFSGEGYFNVKKKQDAIFKVNGKDFCVTVYGTTFNLRSYLEASEVVIMLEEGVVDFSSLTYGNCVRMKPGDISILNRETGQIATSRESNSKSRISWWQKEITFRHVTLQTLLNYISDTYGVSIILTTTVDSTNTFTGIIPADNLNATLDIVERLYQVKCVIEGNRIIIK